MKMKNKLNNDKMYKYIKKEETSHSGIKGGKNKSSSSTLSSE